MVVLRKEQYDSMLYNIRHHAQTTPLPPLKGEVARRAGGVTPSVLLRRTHLIAMIVMSATLRKDLIRHALRARHLLLRGEGISLSCGRDSAILCMQHKTSHSADPLPSPMTSGLPPPVAEKGRQRVRGRKGDRVSGG